MMVDTTKAELALPQRPPHKPSCLLAYFRLTGGLGIAFICLTVNSFGWAQEGSVTEQSGTDKLSQLTVNQKADGYRGIWYMNQPIESEYKYKYSGGLGTYCAKHRPFAIYSPEANKTFFCYGGTHPDNNRALLHMVGEFDHQTKQVSRPTILLDKQTNDAHDNPVISLDEKGHIWIFSTSHGRSRPSYIHRSARPYDINKFELVQPTRKKSDASGVIPITNFSYMQVWHRPNLGFAAFFTRYGYPAKRTLCFMSSEDGVAWSKWQRIAAIEEGHYQISAAGPNKLGTMFNYHPKGKGLNWRTNLYYLETRDNGVTWQNVAGVRIQLPLTTPDNQALVQSFPKTTSNTGQLVYLKDLQFQADGNPVLLFLTSRGFQPGPKNGPRTWMIAKWNGQSWSQHPITSSDNNYDSGELRLNDDEWQLIAPTTTGPQPFNPGGEIAIWKSTDQGKTWQRGENLTRNSQHNHTYVRTIRNAHPDFVAIWADGHARQPSKSRLYFCDSEGQVFQLPESMDGPAAPVRYKPSNK